MSVMVEIHTEGPAMILHAGEWQVLRGEIRKRLDERQYEPEVAAALRRTKVKEVA